MEKETMVNIKVSYDYEDLAQELTAIHNDYEVLDTQYSVVIDDSRGEPEAFYTCMIVYK